MKHVKRIAAVGIAAVAVTGTAGAGSAAASDETLKAAITAVIPQVAPKLKAFVDEADKATTSGDVSGLQQATTDVRTGISQYKWTVINYKASSGEGLAAKKQLLVAIREYDIGFAAYNNALAKLKKGASKASTLKSLKSFAKRLNEAVKDEATALEALGVDA